MTELFGVVNTLDERSRTMGVGSNFWGTCLNGMPSPTMDDVGNGCTIIPCFHRQEVDPSSALLLVKADSGISTPDWSELGLG